MRHSSSRRDPDLNPRTALALLTLAYTCNAMDRGIISIIAQPMKVALHLSDTQLGLLGGTAFAALYGLGGIPIARLAEHYNRVNIITAALVVWSSLTAACALAGNFTQLLLSRIGVGIAEAGCTPPAHSLLSDYFPPARRTSALSVYSCGISLGYICAAIGGGYVAQRLGWRAACAMVGAPGIMIALLVKSFVREPPRGRFDERSAKVALPASLSTELSELRAVAVLICCDRRVLNMVLGVIIGAFANYGFYAFAPAFFNRAFGLDYATTGIIAALTGGIAVGVGIVAGGFVSDRLAARSRRWYALVPAFGTLIATPMYLLVAVERDWRGATLLLAAAGFFQYVSLGPTFGAVQNAVEPRRRATATALLYVVLNMVALGCGPLFTGFAIDRFAAHSSLAEATRHGLMLLTLFYAWASVHYFVAASSVQSDSI